MDATEKQASQKTSTSQSSRRSGRNTPSTRRSDASPVSKARSKDKISKEGSENYSKVDTDNSRSSSSTLETTHKHKSKKGKRKNKDKMDDAFASSSVAGVSAVTSAAMFPEFSPGPHLTTTPTPAIDAESGSKPIPLLLHSLAQPTSIRAIVPGTQLDTQTRRERPKDAVTTASGAATTTSAPSAASNEVTSADVNTTMGKLKGGAVDVYGVNLHRWLGVPYSQLGARSKRFAFAQPVNASSVLTLDAKEPSPPCAQVINDTLLGREDCLRVNVWAPAQHSATAAKRPLLLAMTQDWFSAADAVVMSPNVRLGVLGYLGGTSTAELGTDLAINDAVVAVRWALDNAAAFHADPSKLMLVGHGSGAYVLTAAAQLLKLNCLRAVLEGPVPGSALPANTETVDTWEKLAADLGCRGNSESEWKPCFQDAELSDLLAAAASVTFRFVPRGNPSEWPLKRAAIQMQEVVAGVDVDEVRVFYEGHVKPWAVVEGCAATVTQLYGCTLEYLFTNRTFAYDVLLRWFKPKNESDIVRLLAMLMSGCDTHRIAKGASKAGYHYVTQGSGRTLFEPVLDVDVLAAFLKDGTVPVLKGNIAWHPMTPDNQASRVVFADGTDVMDSSTIPEASSR
ncbi:hypothetical protein MTO96_020124 [Rhipicephalus appendiculatus]